MYALRHKETGKLLRVSVTSAPGDFDQGYEADLCLSELFPVWVVSSVSQAYDVAESTTDWFNASMDRPMNDYVGKVEVVKLNIQE